MKIFEKLRKKKYLEAPVFDQKNDTEETYFKRVVAIMNENNRIFEHNNQAIDRVFVLQIILIGLFFISSTFFIFIFPIL